MLPEDDVFDRRFARRLLDKYPEQFSEGSHSAERGRDDVADSFDPGPEQSGQQQSPVGYRIGAEIGRGGMGAVLEVWDKVLERDLAMKVVLEKPESPRHRRALGRFLREARITGQLDHPGVVPVHDLGVRPDGTAYFTMLRVRGRGLHEIFARALSDDESWSQNRVLGGMPVTKGALPSRTRLARGCCGTALSRSELNSIAWRKSGGT